MGRCLALAGAASALLMPPADALRLNRPLVVARLASFAACSSFQEQTTTQLYDVAAATPACAPYAVTSSSLTYISAPCSATACVQVAAELATQLPDCEIDGINEKAQLQDALAVCAAASASGSAAASSTDMPVSPSASSSSSSSSVGDECTKVQLAKISTLYLEAAESAVCSDYMSTTTIDVYVPCSASACIAVVKDMTAAMPNCSYEGVNFKQELYDGFGECAASIGGSSSSSSSSSSATSYTDIPVGTKSASSLSGSEEICSSSEAEDIVYQYMRAARTAACEAYSTVTANYVEIDPPCSATACLAALIDAAELMPNCSYEGVNYHESLAQGAQDCRNDSSSTGSANGLDDSPSALDGNLAAAAMTTNVWALAVSVGAALSLALAL